jgi:uncharacterized protein (TIGR02147 family)
MNSEPSRISIFQFDKVADYLELACRRGGDGARAHTARSFEAWARRLGYRSPRGLAMVLKGQRLPSTEMITRLARQLKLGERERRYFELLVSRQRAERRGRPVGETLRELSVLKKQGAREPLIDTERFSFIAEWYHLPLRQLMQTAGWREDLGWLSRRLRGKVRPKVLRAALDRLVAIGMAERRPEDGRLVVCEPHIQTSQDVPSEAIRSHHKQMLARAAEALDEQGVEEREVTSITFRCHPSRAAEAKAAIRQFRDQFRAEFDDAGADEVYQPNVQFFGHTRPVAAGKRPVNVESN